VLLLLDVAAVEVSGFGANRSLKDSDFFKSLKAAERAKTEELQEENQTRRR